MTFNFKHPPPQKKIYIYLLVNLYFLSSDREPKSVDSMKKKKTEVGHFQRPSQSRHPYSAIYYWKKGESRKRDKME
jgi:hypothetical protein